MIKDETVYRAFLAMLEQRGPQALAAQLALAAHPEALDQLARLGQAVTRASVARADQRVLAGLPDPLARPGPRGNPARLA